MNSLRGGRLAAGVALALLVSARPALAQCGARRSTCSGCHDGRRAAYDARTTWHADHAFADLCVGCHGGDGAAVDAPSAHVAVDVHVALDACATCHAADAPARLAGYVKPVAAVNPPPPRSPHGAAASNLVLGAAALALGASCIALVTRRERRR